MHAMRVRFECCYIRVGWALQVPKFRLKSPDGAKHPLFVLRTRIHLDTSVAFTSTFSPVDGSTCRQHCWYPHHLK